MTKQEQIIRLSDQLLEFLLNYRKTHPNFRFWLRSRENNRNRDQRRLGNGQWFQGSDYIFLSFYNPSGHKNMTRSIGWVLWIDDQLQPHYKVEVVWPGEGDSALLACYEDIVKSVAGFDSIGDCRYRKELADEPMLQSLEAFIETILPEFDHIIARHNLTEKFEIPLPKFTKQLNQVLRIRDGLHAPADHLPAPAASLGDDLDDLPLNTILYGPPGTGKTYRTITKALSLIEDAPEDELMEEDRKELKRRFEQYVSEGRISFVTFHQSLSYEDFIEGIKPVFDTGAKELSYPVVPGLFKQVCLQSLKDLYQRNSEEASSEDLHFDTVFDAFISHLKSTYEEDAFPFETKDGSKLRIGKNEIYPDRIVVYYQWSNNSQKAVAGKTPFTVRKTVLEQMYRGNVSGSESNLQEALKPYLTYHLSPNYGVYKGLLNFIKDHFSEKERIREESIAADLGYEGYLEKVQAILNSKGTLAVGRPFVLIIDEINRGNVSQIFGELITLLEPDKRLGNSERLTVKLPYSKSEFAVPNNLFLIGTMNTADRSVEALDTALRRRFTFEEMMPRPEVLEQTKDGIDLNRMLKAINERLEVLLDRDHTIGHAWLMGCQNVYEVKEAFENKIIPLLKEFFYNDYSKIGLILGKAFVEKSTKKYTDLFAGFDGLEADVQKELASKVTYKFKMPQDETALVEAFRSIYPPSPILETVKDAPAA
ncbi:AAA family ATPase [Paraflavisolibacter sp. H34]|uniref:McrB family protein n=1 Tax=Huijunlia imazamoxiresistens TaxID=3127457 RepID=UPI003015BE2E